MSLSIPKHNNFWKYEILSYITNGLLLFLLVDFYPNDFFYICVNIYFPMYFTYIKMLP